MKSNDEITIKKYFNDLYTLVSNIEMDSIIYFKLMLERTLKKNSTVYIMGNGGSATTATHFVNDLCKMVKTKKYKFKAISLTDNIAWFSALGNDEGYDKVFVGQLDNFLKEEDLVIGLSASGNSENLIRAFKFAKFKKIKTFALLGFDGGKIKNIVDSYIHIQTQIGEYGIVEDVHSVICHLIIKCLLLKLKKDK